MASKNEKTEQISVLMVCLGNICRSPMAEAVFKHVAKKNDVLGKFDKIDSAGTGDDANIFERFEWKSAYHIGNNPDSRSTACCNAHGVQVKHKARQVNFKDFDDFDYILAMDDENLYNLRDIAPKGSKAKVMMFGDFAGDGKKGVAVEDPYYGANAGFEKNFKQVTKFSENFLKEILGVEPKEQLTSLMS